MQDRIKTLEQISGLKVTHRRDKNEDCFEFYYQGQVVKGCYTYPKARCYAEGVKLGREMRGSCHEAGATGQ